MNIPQKILKFFEQNKKKSKKVIIRDMMEIFNYTESTASLYYSHRNSKINLENLNNNPNIKSQRELVISFFKQNPNIVHDSDNIKYANQLGVKVSTYAIYKMQYQEMHPVEIKEVQAAPKESKLYKGMLRTKFRIDDSKLFG